MATPAHTNLGWGKNHIQQALSNLEKIFRKPPDFSKSKTPGLVKANKKFKSHQEHQQEPEQSEYDYCRKLGLAASGHNNKVAKGLAKSVTQQLGLELVEVSKSNPFIAIHLLSFSLMKIKVNQFPLRYHNGHYGSESRCITVVNIEKS